MSKRIRKMGWLPDAADDRDLIFSARRDRRRKLPARVDLRENLFLQHVPIIDQGNIGSCTGCALAVAMAYAMQVGGEDCDGISALFIYWNERYCERSLDEDRGAQIRTGAKVLNWWGACRDELWPYDGRRWRTQPGRECYIEGMTNRSVEYRRVVGLEDLKAAVAGRFPVVFGFQVYEDFMGADVARDGVAKMPRRGERRTGGHAVLAVGYDDARGVVICRNSWGADWGDAGYFYLPFGYIESSRLSSDFWVISRVI